MAPAGGRSHTGRAIVIGRDEAKQAILDDAIPIYEQEVEGELRFLYYGKTSAGRLLAVVVTERGDNVRVITA